jgi:hypothetical protein
MFSTMNFADLYLRPTRFFRSTELGRGRTWLVLVWLMGMAGTIDQMDRNLFRATIGNPRPGWYAWGQPVVESWLKFWPWILVIGVLVAAFAWYVGGWWFNLRVRWSGDRNFDRREGRLVYTFAGAVSAIPAVIYALLATAIFESYYDAWISDEAWSSVILVFPLWSVATTYRGVRAKFEVRRWPARFWFVILPILFLVLILGMLGVALTLLARAQATVA